MSGPTEEDLAELWAVLKSGVKSVQFRDRKVEYQSIPDLKAIIDEGVAAQPGRQRTVYASFSKGLTPRCR